MSIETYDPQQEPNAEAWLALEEEARRDLVLAWHRGAGIIPPHEELHAAMHAIVENQIAVGGEMLPVQVKVRQLMAQGVSRHNAIHAIGMATLEHVRSMMRATRPLPNTNLRYFSAIRRLDARKWLRSG